MAAIRRTAGPGQYDRAIVPSRRAGQNACRRAVPPGTVFRRLAFLPRRTPARVRSHATGAGRPVQRVGGVQCARIAKGGSAPMTHLMFSILAAVLLSCGMAL